MSNLNQKDIETKPRKTVRPENKIWARAPLSSKLVMPIVRSRVADCSRREEESSEPMLVTDIC